MIILDGFSERKILETTNSNFETATETLLGGLGLRVARRFV
jgi:hypothetical protein